MVETKSAAEAVKNFEAGIGRAGANYKAGIERTSNFIERAIAGEDLYAQKMQDAISRKSRAAGLRKSSDAEWKKAAGGKGAQRIGPGMLASKDKFARGIAEVISTLQGITLPPRTADPLQNVTNRVGLIATTLHEKFKK